MPALTAETVGDVITYLDPGASAVPVWPPDAFAIAAMLLKKSGAYRQVANAWPPPEFADTTEWHNLTEAISARWRASCDANDGGVPAEVKAWWEIVIIHATMPISQIASDRGLFIALVAIVAVCDFACSGFGFRPAGGNTPKEDRANSNLSAAKTLCESIHPSRCIVLPKAHNPFSGMTLRSLTHNLALWDRPEVSTAWENIRLDIPKKSMNFPTCTVATENRAGRLPPCRKLSRTPPSRACRPLRIRYSVSRRGHRSNRDRSEEGAYWFRRHSRNHSSGACDEHGSNLQRHAATFKKHAISRF